MCSMLHAPERAIEPFSATFVQARRVLMRRVIMKTNLTIIAAALLFAPGVALADDVVAEKRPANIVVHVATEDAVLHSHTTSGLEIACVAPCNQAVPADLEYRLFTNEGTTAPFGLQRDAHRVDLSATGASNGARMVGAIVAALGGIATLAGSSVMLTAASWNADAKDRVIDGGAIAGAGVVTLAVGLIVYATSKKPVVTQTIRF